MAKLYFKYGAMGSSKTAQALITKFNYEERGMRVWLIKPALDTRDGASVIRSRIGLAAQTVFRGGDSYDVYSLLNHHVEQVALVILAHKCRIVGQYADLLVLQNRFPNINALCAADWSCTRCNEAKECDC